jgi:hypothetical protein
MAYFKILSMTLLEGKGKIMRKDNWSMGPDLKPGSPE